MPLAYRLTGQRGYLDEAWRWISTAIGYPHWGKAKMPDHDLDAGWLLHGLALAYSWIGDDLGEQRSAALRAKLELQGQRLYDFAVESEGTWWSSSYWQNHNWICYAGLATVGYALGKREWTDRARENFAKVLPLLPRDGSDTEGVVYWRYGVPWLVIYADLLERTTGESVWADCDFLKRTMGWRFQQSLPGFEEHVAHGDCHDRRSGHSVAMYYRLASAYRDGHAQWLADLVADRFFWREAYASGVRPGVMPEAFYELLWFDPEVVPVAPAELPLASHYPDMGQLCARTSWDDPDAVTVSFVSAPGAGNNAWDVAEQISRQTGWETLNAGHHHPDGGSFVLSGHGATLAVDDGYANFKRAAQHNLITVDGQGWRNEVGYHIWQGMPYQARPELVEVLAADGFACGTARTAAMFEPELGVEQMDRTLIFTPAGRLVVWDRCAAREPRRFEFLLHTDWPTEIAAGGAVIRSGPGQCWVTRLPGTPTTVDQRWTQIEANPTGSTPSLKIERRLATTGWATEPVTAAEFISVFEPTSALSPSPARASWSSGLIDFGDEQVALGAVDTDSLASDAAVTIRSGDRVAVVGATSVRLAGAELLSAGGGWTGVLRP